jgi:hypothetical protein
MKVYTLMGGYDYEGEHLLAVFGSKEDLMKFVEQEKSKPGRRSCLDFYDRRPGTLGYDTLGYVESELGQQIDFYGEVKYL